MPTTAPLSALPPAPLSRRLLCMLYEALLLLAVAFAADWLFELLLGGRPVLLLRLLRQVWLFTVFGAYFIWFWRHGGQTLAMKTWRIRLVRRDGGVLGRGQALTRYLLAYLWFLPACFGIYWFGLKGWPSIAALAAGILLWAALAYLDKNRQFLHDRWAGTQLLLLPPKSRKQQTGAAPPQ